MPRHICQAPSRVRSPLTSEPWPPEKYEVITLNAKSSVGRSGKQTAKKIKRYYDALTIDDTEPAAVEEGLTPRAM